MVAFESFRMLHRLGLGSTKAAAVLLLMVGAIIAKACSNMDGTPDMDGKVMKCDPKRHEDTDTTHTHRHHTHTQRHTHTHTYTMRVKAVR